MSQLPVAALLHHDWKAELRSLLAGARETLSISSPYVTMRGMDFVLSNVPHDIKLTLQFCLLTDLSPMNIAQSSTDPAAVCALAKAIPRTRVVHLPRVHAKVYVQDAEKAIVTSGNLTAGGLDLNYEYGLKVLDAPTAAAIERDIIEYAALGALVPSDALESYSGKAEELRHLYRKQFRAVRRGEGRFGRALSVAADDLARLRLAGGPLHTVFAATILYLLAKHGPMSTLDLHPRVEGLHPDLCDNSMERVIDGKRFGKKWKHAVRSAQQRLKKSGRIVLVGDRWQLVEGGEASGGPS